MTQAAPYLVSFEEYAAMDHEQLNCKLEWVNGLIYAMTGGTIQHAALTANATILLGNKLRGSKCRVYSADLRIWAPSGLGAYPDVSVICGEPVSHVHSKNTAVNPALLVEVLSPTTAAYDRGEKFEHYKSIPTLTDYLLVSVDKQNVDHWSKNSKGEWECVPSDSINVLGIHFTVKDLYGEP